jgi:Flp pilus assembly protein TadD
MTSVKGPLVATVLVAGAAIAGALAYQTSAREREYRELLSRGDQALNDDQTFGAIEAYSGAIALRADSMLAHLRRGSTYQQRGDLDAAARDFRKAAELDPLATRPLEALGDVLYLRGRFSQAAEAYDARLRLDNQSAEVTFKLALAHYRAGHLGASLVALNGMPPAGALAAQAAYLRGLCLREQSRLKEAVEAVAQAVSLAPGMVVAREELADLYEALGSGENQLKQLQALADLHRDDPERQIAVGLAHARLARDARAFTDRLRHADLAILALGGAIERHPDQPLLYGAIGQVWLDIATHDPWRTDALNKALEALQRATTATGATSELLGAYGRALLLANQVEAAERVLEQATHRYPLDPSVFLAYAAAAEKRDHPDAARRALIDYSALVGDDQEFVSRAARIGRLSLRVNDPATAVEWFGRATAARPADLELVAALVEAQLLQGDLDGAQATIAAGLEREPANARLLELAER